jgi:hypothetical protein
MKKSILSVLVFLSCLGACATRAPSTHELERRGGLSGGKSDEKTYEADLGRIAAEKAQAKETGAPVRLAPLIARVWVHDQTVDEGHWLQGTWMFVEVEGSRWVKTPDTSGRALTLPIPEKIQSRFGPEPERTTSPTRSALSDRK